MKKLAKAVLIASSLGLVAGFNTACSNSDTTIRVAASSIPHAQILEEAVKPILEEKGYSLTIDEVNWDIPNDSVYNGDADANYFQHRPYLQIFDTGDDNNEYTSNYTYTKVFPVVAVHFEPLRIYEGKGKAADFEANKKTATYVITADPSNQQRALDLLVSAGVIDSYDTNNLPNNITTVTEDTLAGALPDYDYGVLPTNTALTAGIAANTDLPVEGSDQADLRCNVLAANVSSYANDSAYKAKIDVLADALLDESVKEYINEKYLNVVVPYQVDYRA